eukprot:c24451_g1_i2 orf=501-1532(+)
METLGWPPNYVARCPVRLFEAAGGSSSWLPSGTAGEFHMRPLGNVVLYFQLRDMLDNQIIFEHTMRKPDAFIVLSQRFFVIRLENGSYRGFGFSEYAAACEMKKQVQKAVEPHSLQEYSGDSFVSALPANGTDTSISERQTLATCASKKNDSSLVAYESVPKRSSTRPSQLSTEERSSSVPSLEVVKFNPSAKSSKWRFSWKGLASFSYLRNWTIISEAFGCQEQEMEIGYPTDVKHVAHIGWDGPSVGAPSWIDELKPAPDFATGPLREFGQPMGSDWIHDAISAAKWTTPGLGEHSGPPPGPPAEFLDPGTAQSPKKHSKWKVFWLQRRKSRAPSSETPRA